MPPDEWNYPVNNSAYTNTVAKISLSLPKYSYSLIGETAPKEYEEIADLMYVPFDSQKQYHPEYDGFTWSKSCISNLLKKLSHIIRKPALGFPTRSNTNRAEQPQKMARGWKLQIYEV